MIAILTSRAGLWLAAVVAALALVAGFYWWASSNGAARVEAKQARQVIEQAKGRADADAEADRAVDPAERLRRDWSR